SRPRYLMGVGTPLDLVRAIGSGIDLFDCVLPTRNARNGYVFLWSGKLVIKNARYRLDIQRLDPECDCAVCEAGYSRAYLRHAYLAGEILAHRLLTLHNLSVYARLMREARRAVLSGDYQRWALSRVQAFSNGLS
ncbi:MAG TPA: tRNA guanosine(34) transglycosylase Tgt, partial [Polyangiaceae bacterium]